MIGTSISFNRSPGEQIPPTINPSGVSMTAVHTQVPGTGFKPASDVVPSKVKNPFMVLLVFVVHANKKIIRITLRTTNNIHISSGGSLNPSFLAGETSTIPVPSAETLIVLSTEDAEEATS